jgi:hypothetical protein
VCDGWTSVCVCVWVCVCVRACVCVCVCMCVWEIHPGLSPRRDLWEIPWGHALGGNPLGGSPGKIPWGGDPLRGSLEENLLCPFPKIKGTTKNAKRNPKGVVLGLGDPITTLRRNNAGTSMSVAFCIAGFLDRSPTQIIKANGPEG